MGCCLSVGCCGLGGFGGGLSFGFVGGLGFSFGCGGFGFGLGLLRLLLKLGDYFGVYSSFRLSFGSLECELGLGRLGFGSFGFVGGCGGGVAAAASAAASASAAAASASA